MGMAVRLTGASEFAAQSKAVFTPPAFGSAGNGFSALKILLVIDTVAPYSGKSYSPDAFPSIKGIPRHPYAEPRRFPKRPSR